MDSYIDSIELDRDALNLVQTSKEKIQQRRKSIRITVSFSIGLLVIFNLSTRFANGQNEELLIAEKENVNKLAKEDSLKTLAEMRADTLYQQLLKTNPEFTQGLIASFDTLKISKEIAEKERNIAQSSTLSTLGEAALKQNKKNDAFQLASKAWELNPENRLACQLLYKISDDPSYGPNRKKTRDLTAEEHEVYVANLIAKERNEKGRGELNEKTLELIFDQQNIIVHNKDESTKDKLKRYYNEIEDGANALKDKMKYIN
jgi:hypothetical protein